MRTSGNYPNKKHPLTDYLFILLCGIVVYSYSTGAWFNGDDFTHLYILSGKSGNPYIKSITAKVYTGTRDDYYRPVSNLILSILTEFDSSRLFRVVTLSLHLSCGFVLWLFLQKFPFSRRAVFFTVFLFLFNPSINTTVHWISAVGDILTTLFSLCALCLYWEKKPGSGKKTISLVILFYILALLSKEIGVVLPALLLGISIYKSRIKEDIPALAIAFALAAVYFFLKFKLFGSFLPSGRDPQLFSFHKGTLISIFKYFFFLANPFPAHLLWRYPAIFLMLIPQALLAWLFIKDKNFLKWKKELLLAFFFFVVLTGPIMNSFAGWRLYYIMIAWCVLVGSVLTEVNLPMGRAIVFFLSLTFASVTVYWGHCYVKTGEYEQALFSEIKGSRQKNIAILGLPRSAYTSVPVFTWGGVNLALKYFYGLDKNISAILPVSIENIKTPLKIKKISDKEIQISLPDDGYNFFFLNPWEKLNQSGGYKSIQNPLYTGTILKTNLLGKPVSVRMEWQSETPVYIYQNGKLIEISK